MTVNGKNPVTLGAVWPLDNTAARLLISPDDWQVATQCFTKRTDPINRAMLRVKGPIVRQLSQPFLPVSTNQFVSLGMEGQYHG